MPIKTETAAPMSSWGQLKQATWACSLFLTSAFERADTAFERVVVTKKDSEGRVKSYYDPEIKRRITHIPYICDRATGDLYLNEESYVVAGKCLAMAFATPVYTLATMAWHLGKIPFDIHHFLFQQNQPGRSLLELPISVATSLFDAAKAPLFGCAVELSSLYGVLKPYHGRKIEAALEHGWQKGASYREDFRKIPARKGETCLQAARTDISQRKPFFFAHCFQVRGNIHEKRVNVIPQVTSKF